MSEAPNEEEFLGEENVGRVSSLLASMGAPAGNAEVMARQLLKRALMDAPNYPGGAVEALSVLLRKVVEARSGEGGSGPD